MTTPRSLFGFVLTAALAGLVGIVACGSDGSRFEDGSNRVDAGDDSGFGPTTPPTPVGTVPDCTGTGCTQVTCASTTTTTSVSGTVFAPNGTLPLYNVIVFVPQVQPLPDLPTGLTCDRCGAVAGSPIVSTLSKEDGTFRLDNVPAGKDIPLVVQVGKWRRQITIPAVKACQDNALTDPQQTRLPKSKAEGNLPRMAVTTGKCDELACLLPKLGLDASEFTPNTGAGKLNLYQGHKYEFPGGSDDAPAPSNTPSAEDLYDDFTKYDAVVLSCECGLYALGDGDQRQKRQRLYDYVSAGGRVLASHLQYAFLLDTPLHDDVASWRNDMNPNTNPQGPFRVDTSFEKGRALAKWLVTVNATETEGLIPLNQPREDVGAVKGGAQRWIYSSTSQEGKDQGLEDQSTKYFSVNAPIGADVANQCGKLVFADVHLANVDTTATKPDNGFPGSCGTELTPEEKALAFLFFDLASCIQNESAAPVPPLK